MRWNKLIIVVGNALLFVLFLFAELATDGSERLLRPLRPNSITAEHFQGTYSAHGITEYQEALCWWLIFCPRLHLLSTAEKERGFETGPIRTKKDLGKW